MKRDDVRSFKILIIYSLVALIILVLDVSGISGRFLWGVRYAIMLSMPLYSLKAANKGREQRLLAASLFLIAAGDFFLYVPLASGNENPKLYPWGIVLFSLAYLMLSTAYLRNAGKDKREILLALMPMTILAAGFYGVLSFADGNLVISSLLLILSISFMLWNALCVPIRGWYDRTSSRLIVISAFLMLACDAGVGLGMMAGISSELLFDIGRNIVWSAYIPAWAIILMLSSWRTMER
ncbi:lysoplasmalogenase family protein [Youngiibacter multivorans]|uniref:YhhN-like protein n=1 Tax=Youngiibacter multivorans TaxID=937251 RepID=A0ABS4G5J0_9CLOT|nr:lysoplasmalogenase family protein [Youngiibacter multivorans]MBP1919818.1 hypothetical protein [Youngiibacter multivorans]